MICMSSSNNDGHLVTKTFTPRHFTSSNFTPFQRNFTPFLEEKRLGRKWLKGGNIRLVMLNLDAVLRLLRRDVSCLIR